MLLQFQFIFFNYLFHSFVREKNNLMKKTFPESGMKRCRKKKRRVIFLLRVHVILAYFVFRVNCMSWISAFFVFFSPQWPLLQRLSRWCQGNESLFLGPVYNVFYSCLHVCMGTLLLVFIVFHFCIFLESICSAFLAGREEEAGIYPLLAKFIVSRKNRLYIQEIKEGDLNK